LSPKFGFLNKNNICRQFFDSQNFRGDDAIGHYEKRTADNVMFEYRTMTRYLDQRWRSWLTRWATTSALHTMISVRRSRATIRGKYASWTRA